MADSFGLYHETMNIAKAALLTLTSARLSRLVTTDDLGHWFIHNPVDKAMGRYAEREHAKHRRGLGPVPREPWWWKYRSGLDCPFCVGFWAALGVVAVERATRTAPAPIRAAVEVAGTALAVNYVAAHLEARLTDAEDGYETTEDEDA